MANEIAPPPTFCYRHPERETGLACGRCERHICAECARRTDVGYRCPECVHTLRNRYFTRGGYFDPLKAPQTRPILTYLLPVVLCVIWLGQEMGVGSENNYALVRHGATFGPLILRGEIWRLFTSIFLHIGWMHLLFNCFALVSLGREVEAQYGYVRFSAIFLTAGYAGGLLSLAWNGLSEFSAGASGGVFGVLGAELGFLFFHRHVLGETGQERQRQLLGLIAINLFIGFTVVNVNNLAHLGGLITGAGLGYLMAPRYLPAIDAAGRNTYADQAALAKRWWVLGGSWLLFGLATGGILVGWNTVAFGHAPPATELTSPRETWPVVHTSTFSDSKSDWHLGENASAGGRIRWNVADEKLQAQAEALNAGVVWRNDSATIVKSDFYLTVEARQLSGPADANYGLAFRLQDKGYYAFVVSSGWGWFTVQRFSTDGWTPLIDWTGTSAIYSHQPNQLTIVATDTRYAFYTNNRYVGEVEDADLRGGTVGVEVTLYNSGDTGGFEFDNFEVRAPSTP